MDVMLCNVMLCNMCNVCNVCILTSGDLGVVEACFLPVLR